MKSWHKERCPARLAGIRVYRQGLIEPPGTTELIELVGVQGFDKHCWQWGHGGNTRPLGTMRPPGDSRPVNLQGPVGTVEPKG